jgi:hypothetical protein
MTEAKVYTWKCPGCGKLISSLYQEQLEANKNVHLSFCPANRKGGKKT